MSHSHDGKDDFTDGPEPPYSEKQSKKITYTYCPAEPKTLSLRCVLLVLYIAFNGYNNFYCDRINQITLSHLKYFF